MKTIGLLIMAYGTPRHRNEIEPYYTHIRRGRKPSPEALQDLTERYEAIGGVSPLARITDAQMAEIEAAMNERHQDKQFKAYLGLKHIDPFIEDAVQQMHQDGIEEAITLVLAPHYSTFSVKSYNGRAIEEAEKLGGPKIYTIEDWYKEPKFIDYWVRELHETFSDIPKNEWDQTVVIFSAHSLPISIIQTGDPYPEQLQETADLIAKEANIKHYTTGWQSEGNTPEPWIGPDVQDLTRDLYTESGYTHYVYCPVGFVSDHLEVLYDNDYECKVVTDELGVHYHRPHMPNTDALFIAGIADKIDQRLARAEREST